MVYAILAVRWVLALLFFTAGAVKVADRQGFARTIERYKIVPPRYVPALAGGLPGLELALGITLALGVLPAVAGWCASVSLLVFSGAVAINLGRGRRFECGCAGVVQQQISWPLVARNLILAALAALVATWPAGLALWTAGLANGQISAPARNLIAVPLGVIVAAATFRAALAYHSAARAVTTGPARGAAR
ncbi:MAG: MauE/DoxX family redox-associated membrane protein [Solirubrobacteraceae bacterium]